MRKVAGDVPDQAREGGCVTLDPERTRRLREIAGKPKPRTRDRIAELAARSADAWQRKNERQQAAPKPEPQTDRYPRCLACESAAVKLPNARVGCVWCGTITDHRGVVVGTMPVAHDAAPEVVV